MRSPPPARRSAASENRRVSPDAALPRRGRRTRCAIRRTPASKASAPDPHHGRTADQSREPRSQSHITGRRAGFRNTRPVGLGASSVRRRRGKRSTRAVNVPITSSRARSMPMQTCGPAAKARWRRRPDGAGRSGRDRGTPRDRGWRRERDGDVRPRRSPYPRLDVAGGVAVHHGRRRFDSQRLLDCPVHQTRVGRTATTAPAREQVPDGVEHHAFGGLDAAEHDHRGVRHRLGGVESAFGHRCGERRARSAGLQATSQRGVELGHRRAAGCGTGHPADVRLTESTMSRYQPSSSSVLMPSGPARPRASGNGRCRQRPGEGRSELGGRTGRGDRVEAPTDSGVHEPRRTGR